MYHGLKWITGIVFLFFPFMLFATTLSTPPVSEYSLDNGLKLIVQEDHRSPVVLFSIWYKVGGSYEYNGITGISHVLEHMMFRGTRRYPVGVLERMISERGGEQNAMTGNDYTMYFQLLAADQLPLSFQLESDRMQHLLLTQADFEKEIQVVMEERRMRVEDNPIALTYERLMAAAHVNNPYHHPTVGWMTDLKYLTVTDVDHWYHHFYAPNNAVIVVVGDVMPKSVCRLAKHYFGHLKASLIPILKPRVGIPVVGSKQVLVHAHAQLPLLLMGYQTPTLATLSQEDDWKAYALAVLSTLLGDSDSALLVEHLIRGKQIASVAQTEYDPFELHASQFVLTGIPLKDIHLSRLQQAFQKLIIMLQTDGVSDSDLARARAQAIAQHIYQQDTLINQAMDLGVPEMIGLSWRVTKNYVDRIQSVTVVQIRKVARAYLTSERLTTAILEPIK